MDKGKKTDSKPANAAGLKGIIAGDTSISSVGVAGMGLTYRGYTIEDLSEQSNFEEVSYLLLHGSLPTKPELEAYKIRLASYRKLPCELKKILEVIKKEAHPMDIARSVVSVMGMLEPESSGFKNEKQVAERLIGILGPAMLYWYHFANSGIRVEPCECPRMSLAESFLRSLYLTNQVDPDFARALDVSLILYAEHEFAASTFAARTAASTRADLHSAVCAGISTLKGDLHGGANEAVIHYLKDLPTIQEADKFLNERFDNKKLVMGFGHRVYNKGDPRHKIIKHWSDVLSKKQGGRPDLQKTADHLEQRMVKEKGIFPNLDFFAALTYYQSHIPVSLYTPIFVIARTAGWAAHVFEQRRNNKLIRPSSNYVGPTPQPFRRPN